MNVYMRLQLRFVSTINMTRMIKVASYQKNKINGFHDGQESSLPKS